MSCSGTLKHSAGRDLGSNLDPYIPDETTQPPELQTPTRSLIAVKKKHFQYLLPCAVIYS